MVIAQGGEQAGGAAGSATPPVAQTSEERRTAIDRRLNDSLGDFDARIRKEQEGLAQERDARQAAGSASAEGEGDGQKDGDEASGDAADQTGTGDPVLASSTSTGEQQGRPGDLKSDKPGSKPSGTSGAGATGSGAAATEIPDGSDDDIVARRLRRAAEQETDPELKEKLWKEYIEYKKNGQGR